MAAQIGEEIAAEAKPATDLGGKLAKLEGVTHITAKDFTPNRLYTPQLIVEGIEIDPSLVGAARAVTEAHELVHVGQAMKYPNLTWMGTFSRAPGAGFANIALETQAYVATEGLAGLRGVLGSVKEAGRMPLVWRDLAITGVIGGTAAWSLSQ